MHTVVPGWFGVSAVWFLPLIWRLVKSTLPGGAGLRGPGTIRLWLGFICVLVASCALEAMIVRHAGGNPFGHLVAAGLSKRAGGVAAPVVMAVLFITGLPWLLDFSWRGVLVSVDQTLGLGLGIGDKSSDDAPRAERHSRRTQAVEAPLPRSSSSTNAMTPRRGQAAVWRPQTPMPVPRRTAETQTAAADAAEALDVATAVSHADGETRPATSRDEPRLGIGAAQAPERVAPWAPPSDAATDGTAARAGGESPAAPAAPGGGWSRSEPVAPAGWLRDASAGSRMQPHGGGFPGGEVRSHAARPVTPPAASASNPDSRRLDAPRSTASPAVARTPLPTPAAVAGTLRVAAPQQIATAGLSSASVAAARGRSAPLPVAGNTAARVAAAAATPPVRPKPPRPFIWPARRVLSMNDAQTPARPGPATSPTNHVESAPSRPEPVTGGAPLSPSVTETLRAIEENAARWTTLAGASLARQNSLDNAALTAPAVPNAPPAPSSVPAAVATAAAAPAIQQGTISSAAPLVQPLVETAAPPSSAVDTTAHEAAFGPLPGVGDGPMWVLLDDEPSLDEETGAATVPPMVYSNEVVAGSLPQQPATGFVTTTAVGAFDSVWPHPTASLTRPSAEPSGNAHTPSLNTAESMMPVSHAEPEATAAASAPTRHAAPEAAIHAMASPHAAANIETPISATRVEAISAPLPDDASDAASSASAPWSWESGAETSNIVRFPRLAHPASEDDAAPNLESESSAARQEPSSVPAPAATPAVSTSMPAFNVISPARADHTAPSAPFAVPIFAVPAIPLTAPTASVAPTPSFMVETATAASAEPAPRPAVRGHAPTSFEFRPPAASAVELPGFDLLERAPSEIEPISEEKLAQTGQLIEQRLQEFKVPVTVVGASAGPVITRFEIEPALGVRGSQIVGLMKDLSRGLGLTSIRVVETIPGKTCMGLELPNARRQMIRLSEILESGPYQRSASKLTIAMGKDIVGQPIVTDLAKAPHMLVAGTTGSGKSVAINAMILSLLYKATPEEVRLIMIDPKMLELSVYEGIPHLLAPVVTDMKLAANALNWCVGEMEKRYRLMSAVGVRNLASFNQKIRDAQAHERKIGNPFSLTPDDPEPLSTLPMIVVVIDELADLMMVAGKKIEELIARLAQKARAAGIHLILATQRPSVDVITGLIKANIPTRVAFQVSSKIDSRTILDQMGAESLLGQGDMLFLPPGTGYPQRVHGAFVADEEVHSVVEYLKQFGEPEYIEGILDGPATDGAPQDLFGDTPDAEADPLYDEAVAFVVRTRRASISSVQRQLRIGYNRAARLVEQMETAGLVSPMGINGSREVLAPGPAE